ncbi:MAG: hydroxyacid dehydrogenase [Planctomycetota bacterium]|nr:hydroxyacid dehydrogenase [Planctomycetota bacterium]
MAKVLICDPVSSAAVESMKQAGLQVDVQKGISKEDLLKCAGNYEAIVVRSATKITKDVIAAAKALKVVVRGGVGVDNIDCEAAKACKVEVMNTPEASSIAVAELALGHMLALSRFIPQATASMKAGQWEKKKFEGMELYGKTLGLLGIGRIGREVAVRAIAFGMKVIACDPIVKQEQLPAGLAVKMVPLDTVITTSDYMSLHMPVTPETKHMLGKAQFDRMKQGVRIVNCARGGIIDEPALAEAIKAGKVAGAAMDVFEVEPIQKDNPLLSLEQVILTPHLGASSVEGQGRVGGEVARKLIEYFCKK